VKKQSEVKARDRQRKLALRKERVRELDREQLDKVNGGYLMPTFVCPTTEY